MLRARTHAENTDKMRGLTIKMPFTLARAMRFSRPPVGVTPHRAALLPAAALEFAAASRRALSAVIRQRCFYFGWRVQWYRCAPADELNRRCPPPCREMMAIEAARQSPFRSDTISASRSTAAFNTKREVSAYFGSRGGRRRQKIVATSIRKPNRPIHDDAYDSRLAGGRPRAKAETLTDEVCALAI